MALKSFSQFRKEREEDKDPQDDGLVSFSKFKQKKSQPKPKYKPLADPGEPTVRDILNTVRQGQREEEERLDLTDRDLTISQGEEKQSYGERVLRRFGIKSPEGDLIPQERSRSNFVSGFFDELRGVRDRLILGQEQGPGNITPRERDESFRNRGITGLLGLKTPEQRYIDRFNSFRSAVGSDEEADQLASQLREIEQSEPGPYGLAQNDKLSEFYDTLNEDQRKAAKSVRFWEQLDMAFNALDVASFGTFGSLGRLGREGAEQVARSTSKDEIADILRREFDDVGPVTDDVINPMAETLRYIDNPDDVEKVFNRVRFQAQGVEGEAAEEASDNLPVLNNPPEPDEVTGFQFVSPNIEEGLNFNDARRALTSERHARMAEIIRNVDAQSRLATRQIDAIGDWADGAEDTFYIEERGGASLDQLRANAAEKGILTNQKAVISFRVGEGDNAVYTVDVPTTDMERIRADLSEAGIQFRTLAPQEGSTRVAIFDPEDELAENVFNFSNKYDTRATKYTGQGEFIGGETRSEGLREYRRILDEVRGREQGVGRDGNSIYRSPDAEEGLEETPLLPGEQAVQGEDFFMSSAQNTRWGAEARMRAEQRSIRKAKERKALENRNDRVRTAKEVLDNRRKYVSDLRDRFNLSDSELRKVSNNRDIRLMSNYEFKKFIDDMSQRAVELADTRQAKAELMDFLNQMDFKRVENYRRVKGYPAIQNMNAEQLRDYLNTLENYSPGDEFLTQRQLETVDRNDTLQGIRTTREAKERFVEEYKKLTGKELDPDDLDNLSAGQLDRFKGDATLAQENPFYELAVTKVQSHMISAEKRFIEVQEKVNDLAKKAKKSRPRGVVGSAKQALIPQHENIINYLEAAPGDEKNQMARFLTEEELDYANYIERYYSSFYDHLVMQEELKTSRYVDQYFTHTRKKFLEAWSDDGFIDAVRTIWRQHKDDRMVAQIIDQDTGNILSKSKFFANTLYRSGTVNPSKNVTRVFLDYVRMAERKKALDQMIPEIDIYTQSLEPKDITKNGLKTDRSLKTFINEYLNNKKGRRSPLGGIAPQNGVVDTSVRLANSFVSMLDLGFSPAGSAVTFIGDQIATWQALGTIKYVKAWKRRWWDTGLKRMMTDNGSDILKQAEEFTGRNVWKEIADVDTGFGDKFTRTMYGGFSQANIEGNKIFLLGTATKEEMRAGKLSAERMAQMRLDSARWRDLGNEIKSIFGSTSLGQAITKYLGWAIPIMNTGTRNLWRTAKGFGKGAWNLSGEEVGKSLTRREARETYGLIAKIATLSMIGDFIFSEEKDDSFAGQLAWRLRREINTLLQGVTPSTFLDGGPRSYTFIRDLVNNVEMLIRLEEYKTDTRWGDEGDLKGWKGLQRQFTPGVVRQFQGGGGESDDGEGLNIDGESLNIDGESLNIDGESLEI